MALYFETPVQFSESNVISTNEVWHPIAPLLAIASYSQDRGGFVAIFDDLGEPLRDVIFPVHNVSQVTALAWHPSYSFLATGWENGEIKVWNGSDKEFSSVIGPHKAPVILLEFSEKGGRLVSCDSTGSLVGWKVDSKGQTITLFHHDLKEAITHLTFRLTIRNHDFDIEGLAKAAVNGDENALDIFSNWRPKTTARKFNVQEGSDNHCFFVGTQGGSLYYVNEGGVCVEVLNTEGVPLSYILYHPTKNSLIVMMEGLTVGHFSVDSQGQLTELTKVKLSGRGQAIRGVGSQGMVWANSACLAVLTGDLTVRIWDIDSNDNYILPTKLKNFNKDDTNQQINEMFSCITYCNMNKTICAGTNIGRIYFWVKKQNKLDVYYNSEDEWELQNINTISGTIKQLVWGTANLRLPLLSVNCVTKVYIMKEQALCTCFCEKIWGTQKTASKVLLETHELSSVVYTDMQVTDMSINENFVAFTNGRLVSVHDIIWTNISDKLTQQVPKNKKNNEKSSITIKLVNSFTCDNEGIIMYEKNVILLTANSVIVRSSNGSMIANIVAIPSEGEPIGMDVTANFLTVFTMEGFLKVFDLTTAEPKQITPIRNLYDMCNDFGEIIQAKCNSAGNKVALTLAAANLIPDGKLYVWDIEQDKLLSYDFRKYNSSKSNTFDDYDSKDTQQDSDSIESNEMQVMYDKVCSNRIPLSLYWDNEDPRLLVCNAKKLKLSNTNLKKGLPSLYRKTEKAEANDIASKGLEDEDQVVITMFVSAEHGIRIQDIRAVESESKLIAVAAPHIILLNKLYISHEVMSDFNGLETFNKATKEAVLDFSYNLSLGNMDAAFKAIKLIQSPGVWNSLAKMCVKTRRLDVAGVCLGHMGNARAARALRLAVADVTLPQEAKLAVLAIELGMLDEAEQLYIQCERYDLLNKLYQGRNKMDDSLKIAESKDRIHLKHTLHFWAKNSEQIGNIKDAITMYEKSNTHMYEIPRMLIEQQRQLEAYMSKTSEPEILKWWGQYVESQGNMHGALQIYAKAGDIYNQVRTLCFMGEESRAAELTRSGSDRAAYYQMARYYETKNNIEDAVSFFNKANAYGNAVRLCKENNMVEELWNIGLVASTREKIECAKYFEDSDDTEKAILLYHRSGMLHKALELAFKSETFDVLQEIASNLDTNSDPAVVMKCAEYFVANEQFDKAVNLLAIGKKYREALDICLKHNVQLSEDLVEKLTPEKDLLDKDAQIAILESLAENLMMQGNYHLATKKFTQAGDRVRAMKALLKSGDTDKIIFFAGVSRQREIYIMAANYLQSLDWQNKPDILRNIITFYSKGKALDLLANFYVACAQIEIDEFQNYEKAYGALTESSRCLAKMPSESMQHQRAVEVVLKRLTAIRRFIDIRKVFERGDIDGGMGQCRQFLISGGQDLEESVRRGDIYALMIQYYIKDSKFIEAKQVVAELRQVLSVSGNTPISYYLNKELIESLAHGLGISPNMLVPPASKQSSVDNEVYEAEIEEDVEG